MPKLKDSFSPFSFQWSGRLVHSLFKQIRKISVNRGSSVHFFLEKDLEDIEKGCIFALSNHIFTDVAKNARKKSETDICHVMLRGINHQGIFDEEMNAEPLFVLYISN